MDGGGDALAAFIVFVVVLWAGTMGATLLLARFRLASGQASAWDHVMVRGAALLTVTIAMWTLASLAGRIMAITSPAGLVPYLWLVAAVPLAAPPLRNNGSTLISSEHWVYLSMLLTGLGGFVLAAVIMARVIAGGVELQ